jgi:hypothetical protein
MLNSTMLTLLFYYLYRPEERVFLGITSVVVWIATTALIINEMLVEKVPCHLCWCLTNSGCSNFSNFHETGIINK